MAESFIECVVRSARCTPSSPNIVLSDGGLSGDKCLPRQVEQASVVAPLTIDLSAINLHGKLAATDDVRRLVEVAVVRETAD